jgi:hypothetical protein
MKAKTNKIAICANKNGNSLIEMRSTLSPVTDDKTNKQAPTGGVISEIFKARMKIIPA